MFRLYLTRYVAELTCLISHKFNLLKRKMLLLADMLYLSKRDPAMVVS